MAITFRQKTADYELVQFHALMDNYGYLIRCLHTGEVATIDTPDPEEILFQAKQLGWSLDWILNTHHHWDHAGGNRALIEASGCQVICSLVDQSRIDGVTRSVEEGDEVCVGQLKFKVMFIPGHTLGHVAYYRDGLLFCGDTVFVGGCGRLFEGTAEQMFASIQRIKTLPQETQIFCAHEYTEKNFEFAAFVEPQEDAVLKKQKQVRDDRAQNKSTVPTTVAEELATNPFFRTKSAAIGQTLKNKGHDCANEQEVFTVLRKLKDSF